MEYLQKLKYDIEVVSGEHLLIHDFSEFHNRIRSHNRSVDRQQRNSGS